MSPLWSVEIETQPQRWISHDTYHCLYHLLPPEKHVGYELRDRGHSHELIAHEYKMTRSSFIVVLYLIICNMWLLFPLCVIQLLIDCCFLLTVWFCCCCCCVLVLHCCKHMRLSCALNHLLTYLLTTARRIGPQRPIYGHTNHHWWQFRIHQSSGWGLRVQSQGNSRK